MILVLITGSVATDLHPPLHHPPLEGVYGKEHKGPYQHYNPYQQYGIYTGKGNTDWKSEAIGIDRYARPLNPRAPVLEPVTSAPA